MKLLTYQGADNPRLGVRTESGVIDVATAAEAFGVPAPITLGEVVAGGDVALRELDLLLDKTNGQSTGQAWLIDEMGLQLGPVVEHPGKIVCVGLNYRRHAVETNMPIPETPVLFSKFGNVICGSGANVPLPPVATEYDYEVELGVVIGKKTRNVSEDEALKHVFGYCTANDVSVRDLQTRTSQWLLGKTLNNFLPVGPYLVTRDEIPDPQTLSLRTWVNDEIRQDSNTGDMIFSVAQIVSYISRYFPLEPGDIIVTGTPEGVAMGRPDQPWLKPGDQVAVEVEKLGKLVNTMIP